VASSVKDCRDYGDFPNKTITVQGTVFYTVPAEESREQGAPVDSRPSKPVDSRAATVQNSRA
jgi:hypothetical protein